MYHRGSHNDREDYSLASLGSWGPGSQRYRAGWGMTVSEKSRTNRQEKGLWQDKGLGWWVGHPEGGPGRTLVITPLQYSVRCLKSSCAWDSRQQCGDTPSATDFLEAVKVIDLSHDRLKGTKSLSKRNQTVSPGDSHFLLRQRSKSIEVNATGSHLWRNLGRPIKFIDLTYLTYTG